MASRRLSQKKIPSSKKKEQEIETGDKKNRISAVLLLESLAIAQMVLYEILHDKFPIHVLIRVTLSQLTKTVIHLHAVQCLYIFLATTGNLAGNETEMSQDIGFLCLKTLHRFCTRHELHRFNSSDCLATNHVVVIHPSRASWEKRRRLPAALEKCLPRIMIPSVAVAVALVDVIHTPPAVWSDC